MERGGIPREYEQVTERERDSCWYFPGTEGGRAQGKGIKNIKWVEKPISYGKGCIYNINISEGLCSFFHFILRGVCGAQEVG